ncbi:MAG: oxidoreductase [Bacteroidia bacterium]
MFTLDKVESQKGRIAIVTGANTGLGYETALGLAQKEATIIMACRSLQKAETAKQNILAAVPQADIDIIQIDLSKLASVRAFAKAYLAKYQQLDLLVNNAGVMMPPYTQTEDGFELQMGANHLGHFLLTGLLLESLTRTPGSRVVSLSSLAHQNGKINFDNLNWEKDYSKTGAYGQSKLACLMYGYELQRRLKLAGADTLSVIAHPGVSDTELGRHFPKWLYTILSYTLVPLISQSAAKGALPTLMAALDNNSKGGEYYGPTGFQGMKGKPGLATSTELSQDPAIAKKLWEVSEDLTGITYL